MPLGICNILYLIGLMPYASRPCMQPAQPAAAASAATHPRTMARRSRTLRLEAPQV
jgi:hypothetical protein